jgi:hypothetical protein
MKNINIIFYEACREIVCVMIVFLLAIHNTSLLFLNRVLNITCEEMQIPYPIPHAIRSGLDDP